MMLNIVPKMMMVLVGLTKTSMASHVFSGRDLSLFNGVRYSKSCCCFVGMQFPIISIPLLTLVALSPFLQGFLGHLRVLSSSLCCQKAVFLSEFWCIMNFCVMSFTASMVVISSCRFAHALFAPRMKTVIGLFAGREIVSVCSKITLAFGALFGRFDIRHIRFLSNRHCLGSGIGYSPMPDPYFITSVYSHKFFSIGRRSRS